MDTRAVQKVNFSVEDFFSDDQPLREKCAYSELFLVRISPYSVRMRKNTDQKNSKDGPFSDTQQIHRRLWIRSYLLNKLLAENFNFREIHTWGVAFIYLYSVHKQGYADPKTVFIPQCFIQRKYYEWAWFWKYDWLEYSRNSINLRLFLGQQDIYFFHKNKYIWLVNLISVVSAGNFSTT